MHNSNTIHIFQSDFTYTLQLSLSNFWGKTSDPIEPPMRAGLPTEASRLTILAFDMVAEEKPGRASNSSRFFQ